MNSPSTLCFGCEALGGTDWGDVDLSILRSTLLKAFDLGVNFLDTAPVYGLGRSESELGTLFKDVPQAFIASKCGLIWSRTSPSHRAVVTRDSSKASICLLYTSPSPRD